MKLFVKNVIFQISKLTNFEKKIFAENVPNGTGKHYAYLLVDLFSCFAYTVR